MRQRKPANIQGELQQYAPAIVQDPTSNQGHWVPSLMPTASELHVDLGCGKGFWLSQIAGRNPDYLYIGLDNNNVCVARTAAKLMDGGLSNAFVGLMDADNICQAFAPGEITHLHLNFNSPFPPKKYAWKRLTYLDRLLDYRILLGEDGVLEIRTDHDPYWEFSLMQLKLAGYRVIAQTDDLINNPESFDDVMSEYHARTTSQGALVHALKAIPGPKPTCTPQQTAPLGLVEYLPQDLSTLTRIPYGMEGTIENLSNKAANAARKARKPKS